MATVTQLYLHQSSHSVPFPVSSMFVTINHRAMDPCILFILIAAEYSWGGGCQLVTLCSKPPQTPWLKTTVIDFHVSLSLVEWLGRSVSGSAHLSWCHSLISGLLGAGKLTRPLVHCCHPTGQPRLGHTVTGQESKRGKMHEVRT